MLEFHSLLYAAAQRFTRGYRMLFSLLILSLLFLFLHGWNWEESLHVFVYRILQILFQATVLYILLIVWFPSEGFSFFRIPLYYACALFFLSTLHWMVRGNTGGFSQSITWFYHFVRNPALVVFVLPFIRVLSDISKSKK